MKKKAVIGIVCGAIVLILSAVWMRGRNVKVFESLDASSLSKISVYLGGQENLFTEQESLKKIVAIFQSMRLNKKVFSVNRDGGLSIDLYCQNGEERGVVMYSDCIGLDGNYYTCDSNYCDAIVKLCEERDAEITADLGQYLYGELSADKVKKVTVSIGPGHIGKDKQLAGEQLLQFSEIIKKIQVIEKCSQETLVGQTVRCEIVQVDDSVLVLQAAFPYFVVNDTWYKIGNGPCEELNRFANSLFGE